MSISVGDMLTDITPTGKELPLEVVAVNVPRVWPGRKTDRIVCLREWTGVRFDIREADALRWFERCDPGETL
jgi:hypothetical protein